MVPECEGCDRLFGSKLDQLHLDTHMQLRPYKMKMSAQRLFHINVSKWAIQ